MKTNSKFVKDAVQKFILNTIDTDGYDEYDGTLKSQLSIIADEFKSAAVFPDNLKRFKTYQGCFIDWAMGAPSCLSLPIYTSEILDIMASFGLPKPDNKTDQEGEQLFYYLIFTGLSTLWQKNGISIYN